MYIQTSINGNQTMTTVVMSDGTTHFVTDPATIVSISAFTSSEVVKTMNLEEIELAVSQLIEPKTSKKEQFVEHLSGLLSLRDGKFYWGDEEIPEVIDTYLGHVWKEYRQSPQVIEPLIKFLEDLYENVDNNVREQLFQWLISNFSENGIMRLTQDGRIVGYKGVQVINMIPHSINEGKAFVSIDGGRTKTEYEGKIPYPIGAIATMKREDVEADPYVGCASGLHLGNLEYATNFGYGSVITAAVYPRHVVSVPTECQHSKLRCEQFQVISLGVSDSSTIIEFEIPEGCMPPKDDLSYNSINDLICIRELLTPLPQAL